MAAHNQNRGVGKAGIPDCDERIGDDVICDGLIVTGNQVMALIGWQWIGFPWHCRSRFPKTLAIATWHDVRIPE